MMAKRHHMAAGDWQSVIGRLQELVLANSGEDEFQEIFKLIVAKLLTEQDSERLDEFSAEGSAAETKNRIDLLLAVASDRWRGIIDGEARSLLTPDHLQICVDAIARLSVMGTNFEVLDNLFEYLVSRVAKGSKGQYFTPRHVIDCCVRIVNPGRHETVVDPACGSAGFLVHTLQHQELESRNEIRDYCGSCLWGFDFDRRAIQVSKALMLVAGDGAANIFQVNSLLTLDSGSLLDLVDDGAPRMTIEDVVRTRFKRFRGFDVVLTNPPFAGEIKEDRLLAAYDVGRHRRRIERDALFIERCIRLLCPGGRLAIVLPHNKFAGQAWGYLRQWLLRHARVVAVLGLDRCTFLPHTHQKAGIIFATKRDKPLKKIPPDEPLLSMVSESSGKDSKGRVIARPGTSLEDALWDRADHDLHELVPAFHNFVKQHKIAWGQEKR